MYRKNLAAMRFPAYLLRLGGPMENKITLRKLENEDLDLFKKWVYAPHVAKWYEEPLSWIDEIEKRKGEFNWIHHFIAEFNGIPVGFCQYYEYKMSGETWHGEAEVEGAYSIDYMIGDPNFLGRGLSKTIVKELIAKIRLHPNAKRVIVQPEPENVRSCGLLLSSGFRFDTRNEIYVMELDV
jgi:RimJ/RimL family protein N-acetyltransferase